MQQLLLLHGAIGSSQQLEKLRTELQGQYDVHTLNFSGHGGLPMPISFSIESFAEDILLFLDTNQIPVTAVFGYSMGGYAAMYLARKHPERISKLITLATKFHWDKPTAEKEVKMLNPSRIEEKLPAFAELLKQRHRPEDWKQVLQKTASLLTEMGKNNPLKLPDYASIQIPVKLMLGDRDKMVSLEETLQVFRTLPNAQLAVIPATQHPVEAVNTARLAFEIRDFLSPIPS